MWNMEFERFREDVLVILYHLRYGTMASASVYPPVGLGYAQEALHASGQRLQFWYNSTHSALLICTNELTRARAQVNVLRSQLDQRIQRNNALDAELLSRRRNDTDDRVQLTSAQARSVEYQQTAEFLQSRLVAVCEENEGLTKELAQTQRRQIPEREALDRHIEFADVISELLAGHRNGIWARQVAGNCSVGSAEQAGPECSVCRQNAATVVARPCHHLFACATCAVKLVNQDQEAPQCDVASLAERKVLCIREHKDRVVCCPACRTNVDELLYIYVR